MKEHQILHKFTGQLIRTGSREKFELVHCFFSREHYSMCCMHHHRCPMKGTFHVNFSMHVKRHPFAERKVYHSRRVECYLTYTKVATNHLLLMEISNVSFYCFFIHLPREARWRRVGKASCICVWNITLFLRECDVTHDHEGRWASLNISTLTLNE